MTTITRKSPGLLDAEADARRLPVERILDWIAERPAGLSIDDCVPLLNKAVGHDVEVGVVSDAITHLGLKHRALATSPYDVVEQFEKWLAADIDRLLDVTLCGTCRDVITDGTSRVACNDTGEEYCDTGCHTARHAGGPCDAWTDR